MIGIEKIEKMTCDKADGTGGTVDYILRTALDIGQGILCSGGEIHRVEDTIARICRAFGAEHCEVFTITNLIIASVRMGNGDYSSQTRRVSATEYDLHKLAMYNELSRNVCSGKVGLDEAQVEIKRIKKSKPYPKWLSYIAAIFSTGGFVLFFGGGIRDALVSAVIGITVTLWLNYSPKYINSMAQSVITTFVSGILAIVAVRLGIGISVDKIMIGEIMILIPGLNIGIAIRDIVSGDIVTGLMRFIESVVKAGLMAMGFAGAAFIMGVYR